MVSALVLLLALLSAQLTSSSECLYPHPKTLVGAKGIGCSIQRGQHIKIWYVNVWVKYAKGKWERQLEPQFDLRDATDSCEAWMTHIQNVVHKEE